MSNLEDISQKMKVRYTKRYKELGYDVKTLGWGSREQQFYRFKQTLCNSLDFNSKTILDIGCGFGDYVKLLFEENIDFSKYYGCDVNKDLIDEAKKIWAENPKVEFHVQDIIKTKNIRTRADIGIMLGLLNLNLKDSIDNYEYSKELIKNAYSLVEEVLIIDFLSSVRTEGYEKEDFVFYHSPSKMLDFALSLSNNVVLKHNYQPIPQKEFMLFIYK